MHKSSPVLLNTPDCFLSPCRCTTQPSKKYLIWRLDDNTLWRVARSQRSEADGARLRELLEKNAADVLTAEERLELDAQVAEADRLMLRKAHAAALLQWRGHAVPPLEKR